MATEYLTTREAAEILRVSEQTVQRLAKSGELPSRKVGSRYRIPASAVLAEAMPAA